MNIQITDKIDLVLPGQRPRILLHRIFSYPIHFPIKDFAITQVFIILNLCITFLGIIFCLINIWVKRENKRGNAYLSLLISAIILSAPVLFLPLDWDRYYLLAVFFTFIFFSIGLSQLIFYTWNMVFGKKMINELSIYRNSEKEAIS